MSRTVAVIQARLGSQRFPEKMLALLGGKLLIEWVVTRVRASTLVDRVVVATTRELLDDRLVAECERLGVEVKRGPTDDVLRRFIEALEGDTADAVVRVCADNPFIDGECIDRAIAEYRQHCVDYAFNHRPFAECNYADGFGAEMVSREVLERLNRMELTAAHREHVTLAVVDGTLPVRQHACVAPNYLAYPDLRFDVDTPADLAALQQLVDDAGLTIGATARDIVRAAQQWGSR
jgi:spore coat polysaccharide biosynthesis protein SpsF (cytidylyltransferase family)